MKPYNIWVVAILLGTVGCSKISRKTNQNDDLICPDTNLENCYSKNFIPTNEWQTIKPDQIVPEGLHYRLNFETGIKEAKLLEQDNEEEESNRAVIIVEPEETESKVEFHKDDSPIDVVSHKLKEHHEGEGENFYTSVEELHLLFKSTKRIDQVIDSNLEFLNQALDDLIYSTHDLKFGEDLTSNNQNLAVFFTILNNQDVKQIEIKEKLLRIIGSSIRNNAKSIENVLSHDEIFHNLSSIIEKGILRSDNQILIKRVIGIFDALIYNPKGLENFNTFKIERFLLSYYDNFDSDVKKKCDNLFEDVNLLLAEQVSISDEL